MTYRIIFFYSTVVETGFNTRRQKIIDNQMVSSGS